MRVEEGFTQLPLFVGLHCYAFDYTFMAFVKDAQNKQGNVF
jgi:hypothetical protein